MIGLFATAGACGGEDEATGGSGPGGTEGSGGSPAGTGGSGAGSSAGGHGGEGDCDPSSSPEESSCVLTDELGIFVASTGDDAAPGTRDQPVKTLAHAVELAQQDEKRVYACAQTFSEVVTVPSGVEIYGGLACETDWGWVASKPTQVTAAADQIPVMRLLGGEGKTVLSDLRITASDASAPGGSSIAVIVDAAEADLVRCIVEAGEAQHGAAGANPSGPATAGANGIAGSDAGCDLATAAGGAQVVNPACPTSIGGKGGSSAISNTIGGGSGSDGQPAATMSTTAGDGGQGQPSYADSSGPSCTPGQPGESGQPGDSGVGGVGKGSLSSAGYVGIAGTSGTPGAPAQGGGGGGGGRGCLVNNVPKGDDAGGSGGAGGCGGAGGVAGNAGGASIALVLLNATVTLEDCIVSSATAGNGGAGGAPQPGGAGGNGGLGSYDNPLLDYYKGCKGGAGGTGGTGGPGGGGAGGHSLAIAYTGTAPTKVGGSFGYGASGKGGLGSGDSQPLAGSDGIAAESQEF